MSWAMRRRIFIVFVILAVIGGITFYELSPSIFKAGTCTDGIQNGTEAGIDCGAESSCNILCTFEVKSPTVLWSRAFLVSGDVYNAVAYIENKNDAAVRSISYEFRLYDEKGILISRIDNTTTMPPKGRYAIVETGIQVGSATVARTTLDFSSTPALWEKISPATEALNVLTNNITLNATAAVPRLSASVLNPSPTVTLSGTVIAAILYGADDNAVNVSRTVIPKLAPGATIPIFFTWPKALSAPVTRYELVPIINVFDAK